MQMFVEGPNGERVPLSEAASLAYSGEWLKFAPGENRPAFVQPSTAEYHRHNFSEHLEGSTLTDHSTGERWRYRDGFWVKTWTHKRAETRNPQGRAQYERRYENGAKR